MENVREKQKEKDASVTSSEAFQNKLIVWFEEKGVLAELRTHLRHHMIETLKASHLGRQMSFDKKKNYKISPKHQAINLLIAEYLLHQGYQYSMSVFSSEVGNLQSLPGHTLQGGGIRFRERDVADILEALGLPMECEEAQCIASVYCEGESEGDDCLLVCLLRMLPPALRNKYNTQTPDVIRIQEKMKKDLLDDLYEEYRNCKDKSKVYRDKEIQCNGGGEHEREQDLEMVVRQIHENMQQAFDHEIEIVKEEERQRYESIISEKERKAREQIEEERKKSKKAENRVRENMMKEIEEEKSKLCEEYKRKEIEMERDVARELETERYRVLEEYREMRRGVGGGTVLEGHLGAALDRLQEQSNRLRDKEKFLDKRLKEVEEKFKLNEKVLCEQTVSKAEDSERLEGERESIKKLRCELERVVTQLEDERNIKKVTLVDSGKETVSKDVQTEKLLSSIDTQTECEPCDEKQHKDCFDNKGPTPAKTPRRDARTSDKVFDSTLKVLQKENLHLKSLTCQQSSKIEELMLKQLNMSMEVSEARVQVQELSKQLGDLLKPVTIPVKSDRNMILREMLSGKKTRRSCRSKGSSSIRNRRLSKKSFSESSSEEISHERKRNNMNKDKVIDKHNNINSHTEGEDSPTDEVLRDAKRRLKMLELETEAVDRSYQEFKSRQGVERRRGTAAKSGDKERRCAATTILHTTDYQIDKKKPDIDTTTTVTCQYTSPSYNIFRRVHQPTMNMDNNTLQNYISANRIKCNSTATTGKAMFQNNNLPLKPVVSMKISPATKFSGTTAFLLRRIENCTSNIRKFDMEKINNTTNIITADNWRTKVVLRKENNDTKELLTNESLAKNTNHQYDYSQYIGKSSQQHKIKPLIHWRNIQTVQKITEENKLPDCDIVTETEHHYQDSLHRNKDKVVDMKGSMAHQDNMILLLPRQSTEEPTNKKEDEILSDTGGDITNLSKSNEISKNDSRRSKINGNKNIVNSMLEQEFEQIIVTETKSLHIPSETKVTNIVSNVRDRNAVTFQTQDEAPVPYQMVETSQQTSETFESGKENSLLSSNTHRQALNDTCIRVVDDMSSKTVSDIDSKVVDDTGSKVVNDIGNNVVSDTGSNVVSDTNNKTLSGTDNKVLSDIVLNNIDRNAVSDTGSNVLYNIDSKALSETGSKAMNDTGTNFVSDTDNKALSGADNIVVSDICDKVLYLNNIDSNAVSDTGSNILYDTDSKALSDTGSKAMNDIGSKAINDAGSIVVSDTDSKTLSDVGSNVVNEIVDNENTEMELNKMSFEHPVNVDKENILSKSELLKYTNIENYDTKAVEVKFISLNEEVKNALIVSPPSVDDLHFVSDKEVLVLSCVDPSENSSISVPDDEEDESFWK